MQLGETIATYDVALALRGESGKFEVTCPTGESFHVTCKPNHSISNLEWSGRADPQPFVIRKIAEPVAPEVGKATVPHVLTGPPPLRAPFLLENEGTEIGGPLHDRVAVLAKTGVDHLESGEATGLDLIFLESDLGTKRPSACICLKGETADRSQRLMTAVCTSLNEFDSEIRRLHAQLDEIRSRARKLFYQAGSIAASA